MTPTRRDVLAGAAGLALAGATRAAPAASLDAIARARGLRFGTAVAAARSGEPPGRDTGGFANPRYAALVAAECGLVVPENAMKWQAIRPAADRFDFARLDAIVAAASARGLGVRGHTLLWHQPKWMPRWAETRRWTAADAATALTTHIKTVVRRYAGRIRDHDVVNETVNPADGSLHETALSRALGGTEATVDLAFRTARAAGGPATRLVYNDYMSWEPGHERHRAGVLRLLEGFRRRGVPVDALGIQSHIVTRPAGEIAGMERAWRGFLNAVTAMGYGLVLTEFDVRDTGLPADIAVRDRAVADYARAYLDITLANRAVTDLLAWGLCDRYSWIEGFDPRDDGMPRRPTLYDAAWRAKPLRAAVAAALAAAPAR